MDTAVLVYTYIRSQIQAHVHTRTQPPDSCIHEASPEHGAKLHTIGAPQEPLLTSRSHDFAYGEIMVAMTIVIV